MALSSRRLHWYQTYVWEWWHALVLSALLLAFLGLYRGAHWALTAGQRVRAVSAEVDGSRVVLSARTSARLISLPVNAGDQVKEGQLIARLDDRELKAAVREAEAALVAARSQVAGAEAALDLGRLRGQSEVQEAQAAVAAAEAALRQARTQARLQSAQQVEEIRRAEATLGAARAGLHKAQEGPLKQEVALARSGLAAAEARLAQAKARMDRTERLLRQGFVSDQQVEANRTALEVAEAEHRAALEKLSLLEAGTRPEDVEAARQHMVAAQAALALTRAGILQADLKKEDVARQGAEVQRAQASLTAALSALEEQALRRQEVLAARAQVRRAEATLAAAQVALAEAELRSPVDGVVLDTLVHVGELVNANQPVARIVSSERFWITATLPETEIRKVRVGEEAEIKLDSFPGRRFRGEVEVIRSSTAAISWPFEGRQKGTQTEMTQEVPVKIAFDYGKTPLRPGMSASVVILLNRR